MPPGTAPGVPGHVADLAGEEHEPVRLDDLAERQRPGRDARERGDGLGHGLLLRWSGGHSRRPAASTARSAHQARSSPAATPDPSVTPLAVSAPFRQPRSSSPTIQARSSWASQSPRRDAAPAVGRRPVARHDLVRGERQLGAVRDDAPAELDRDRRPQGHLPVDPRDVVVVQPRDVGELDVAVQPDRRQRRQRRDERRRVAPEPIHEGHRRGRGEPLEPGPAAQEDLPDRVAVGGVAGRRARRQQRQALGEGTPWRRRAGPRRRRLDRLAPGRRMELGDPLDQGVGLRRLEDDAARLAPPRPELVGEVAHQDRRPAVGRHGRAEVRRRDARVAGRRRASPASHASRMPSSRVARTIQSLRGGAVLEDEPVAVPLEQPERGPGPAVGRERRVRGRHRGRARPAGRRAGARASRSRACGGRQHGAGTSSAPGGPSSRYSTNESGQLRVSTTTSGSIVEAFSSTWISPAGM